MRVSELIEAVTDRWSVEAVTDDKLKRRIATAVAFYSRYNPVLREYAFTTVTQSDSYEVPLDCVTVRSCEYVSSLSFVFDVPSMEAEYSYALYSQRIIETIKRSEQARYRRTSFVLEGRRVILRPTPTVSGLAILMKYAAPHKVSGDGEDYLTIPQVDFDIIADLALAELVETKRVAASVLPNYTEGLTEIVRGHIPASARATAAELRAKCITKFSSPVVMI